MSSFVQPRSLKASASQQSNNGVLHERPARGVAAPRHPEKYHSMQRPIRLIPGTSRLQAVSDGEATGEPFPTAESPRNLVVAVDSSEDSVAAFRWTLHNLYRSGDALHVLHVLPEAASSPASGSLYYPADNADEVAMVLQQADEYIQSEFVQLAAQKGVDVNVVLVKDSRHKHIGWAVCRKAEELEAAPLVLATHHKSYFAEMLLGSVSKFCAANCMRPVLLVHPDHSNVAW